MAPWGILLKEETADHGKIATNAPKYRPENIVPACHCPLKSKKRDAEAELPTSLSPTREGELFRIRRERPEREQITLSFVFTPFIATLGQR